MVAGSGSAPGGSLPSRPFGQTGLEVTSLCIGCAPLGDMPETFAFSVAEEQALATLRAVFDSPIRFVDTAASYGDGESERRIGAVLSERRDEPQPGQPGQAGRAGQAGAFPEMVVATKADRDLHSGDFSGPQMRRSVERSLRLLGLERLEICYLHDPEHTSFEAATAPGGAVPTLLALKEEGLIGHVGLAGGPIDLSIRYVETGAFEAVITHNRYTLLNRSAEPLIEMASRRGLAVVNAAPYGSGILAKGPDAYPRYAYQDAPARMIENVRRLADICRRYDVPLAAAALQFSMRDPRVVSTIVGMSRPERVAQTLELAGHPIPDALWPELDAVGYDTDDPELERWNKK